MQPTNTQPTTPFNTFFRHNNPVITQFDWLAHLDRRLVNPIELRHVSAARAHELTHKFADNVVQMPVTDPLPIANRFKHTAGWFTADTNLFRAFEGLTTKPWTHAVPEGGRTPGRVNINMVWDPKVLLALLDPHDATSTTNPHGFDTTHVYDSTEALSTQLATAKSLWVKMFAGSDPTVPSRTKNFPNVGVTVDETTADQSTLATADRPFKGLGVATYMAGPTTARPDNGIGIADTILRADPASTATPPEPLILMPDTSGSLHPYQRDEMLRKLFNQITTVSDTYLVLFTIGYFEVRNEDADNGANGVKRIVLGKEIHRDTPGDLRVQYAAVVDRSALAVNNTNAWNNTSPPDQPANPIWFTEVAESAPVGSTSVKVFAQTDGATPTPNVGIWSDGTFHTLAPGSLRIGTGNSAETLSVTAVGTLNTTDGPGGPAGVVTLTVGATTSPHGAGSAVTAADRIPGNPGPRTDFDVFTTTGKNKYGRVVPYVVRMTP